MIESNFTQPQTVAKKRSSTWVLPLLFGIAGGVLTELLMMETLGSTYPYDGFIGMLFRLFSWMSFNQLLFALVFGVIFYIVATITMLALPTYRLSLRESKNTPSFFARSVLFYSIGSALIILPAMIFWISIFGWTD